MKSWLGLVLVAFGLAGCASIVNSVTEDLAADLSATILNSDDPATIRDGIPAYLILIDSLINGDPDNEAILTAASQLNGAFVNLLDDPERGARLTEKSLQYAVRAACVHDTNLCEVRSLKHDEFLVRVAALDGGDLGVAYSLAVAWLGWIQAHSDDWGAIGELSRPRALLERLLEIDEGYDAGALHLYLGALDTLLPEAMGGQPESGRAHLERALELSGGRYLMTSVIYARQYARLQFDQELHDRLLEGVLAADPHVPGMTLANVLAQEEARVLLAESSDYF